MRNRISSIQPYTNNMSFEWQSIRRILAIRLDNIGDIIMLSPALYAIQSALPEAEITLMASPSGSQAATLLPWIHDVITWRAVWQDISGAEGHNPENDRQLAGQLRSREFQAAFIFTSFSQSPYPPAYVCYLAGIPIRIGQSDEFGGGLLTHWVKPPAKSGHQVDRNLHLVQSSGIAPGGSQIELFIPGTIQKKADQLLRSSGIEPDSPYIVLAPGASASARRYDPARYAEVVEMVSIQSGIPVVVVGTERERGMIQPVITACEMNRGVSLVGLTSVPEMAAIIRKSSLVISNNSAALHMADAFLRPLVVTYSGTEYLTQWEPRYSPASLLRRETVCSPCFLFQCPYQMQCLDLPPEEVVRAAISLLGNISTCQADRMESIEIHPQIPLDEKLTGGTL